MTRQELQEKIIDLYAGSAPKRTLPGVFSDEILHLIDEYANNLLISELKNLEEVIKPEYHGILVSKINELRSK